MLAKELAPPTFQDEDGRWLRVWKARLKRLGAEGPHSLRWPAKVHDPAYWAERKIQLQRIEVPTFLVGGWRDLYPEATVRAYEEISSRRRLLVGPWLHAPPDLAEEPIDWLGELASFFDQQLGDASGGDEPPVTIFVQGGEWRDEGEWPIARTTYRTWYPAPRGVLAAEQAYGVDDYMADPTVGARAGLLDPLGLGVGLPRDQGPDDLASLTYTSAALPDELEITGSPAATLAVVAEGAAADLSVKLVDVGPDGRASLVTSGGARHSGNELVQVGLYATSYVIPEGHRLCLSIACADFPRFWPTPQSKRIGSSSRGRRSFFRSCHPLSIGRRVRFRVLGGTHRAAVGLWEGLRTFASPRTWSRSVCLSRRGDGRSWSFRMAAPSESGTAAPPPSPALAQRGQ